MARPRKKAPTVKGYAPDFQDVLVKRITDCRTVLDHLKECPAWQVIQDDLKRGCAVVDSEWFKLPEGDQRLQEHRVTKLAYMHLLNIESDYNQDLLSAQAELDKLQGTEKKIIKDYDVESPLLEK